eukprot:1149497-Pelagomonas_calceolata.AAC.5
MACRTKDAGKLARCWKKLQTVSEARKESGKADVSSTSRMMEARRKKCSKRRKHVRCKQQRFLSQLQYMDDV